MTNRFLFFFPSLQVIDMRSTWKALAAKLNRDKRYIEILLINSNFIYLCFLIYVYSHYLFIFPYFQSYGFLPNV